MAVNTSELGATSDYGMPAGESYYEYLLLNVDIIVVASRRGEQVMQDIRNTYCLKKDNKAGLPYGQHDIHIGAQIYRHQEPDDYVYYL